MDYLKLLFVVGLLFTVTNCKTLEEEEEEARQVVDNYDAEITGRRNREVLAEWDYSSNITDENEQKKTEVSAENAKAYKKIATVLREYDYSRYKDEDLKRKFKKLTKLDYAALEDEKYRELLGAINSMESNYAKVKVCDYNDRTKCDLALDPELEEIIAKSRDPEELKYYWAEWYNNAGTPTREAFDTYIALNREAAQLNNFTSGAEMWLGEYEDDHFEQDLDAIFEEMKPLYRQLHAYVRFHLRKKYGDKIVSERGPIPMHLLGNMWAQSWEDIADLMTPFPDKPLVDVSDEMVKQNYTALQMFHMGDEFFQSLNMTKLPQTFWEKSILEKPNDGRELVCHASAWDFYAKDDVRIKQCTRVNMEQLFVVHHELGHIQYFLQYQHLPTVYREGANPGFHEAVGDVLSLSVSTPKHLKKIGLLSDDFVYDKESRLNALFRKSLEKIIFLPFAFTMDKYRWAIFRGNVKPENYNCAFWKLREDYSGIEPPVQRTEADFDAPAKYHISADVEYLRYLVSYIVQFQFYKSACEKAGQYVPGHPELVLDNCDIFDSPQAGNAFKAMLSLGSSVPWPDAMEVFTGERRMKASAIIEYFEPLRVWLEEENKKSGAYVGWEPSDKCQ